MYMQEGKGDKGGRSDGRSEGLPAAGRLSTPHQKRETSKSGKRYPIRAKGKEKKWLIKGGEGNSFLDRGGLIKIARESAAGSRGSTRRPKVACPPDI